MSDVEEPDFEQLLEELRVSRGFDFTGYKRASLRRRVTKRMADVGVEGFPAYQDYLQVHPEEFNELFNGILINVTAFFRDPEYWAYLREQVLPEIVGAAGEGPIRVWSAGCSSGEEAYTIAMLLAELLPGETLEDRVKIYATDVDEDALRTARHATYPPDAVRQVPEELRERHMTPVGDRFAMRPELRRAVIFGRHDLVSDAPISRLDLLVCRNLLMYFNRDTQAMVLRNLHFALKPSGYLFLGKAEMLLTRTELFEPVELKHRVFRPVRAPGPRPAEPATESPRRANSHVTRHVRLRDAAFGAAPVAQVAVDLDGIVTLANEEARLRFGLGGMDIGRPLRDLELSFRPAELRGPIERAYREGRAVQLRNVQHQLRDGNVEAFDVWVTPLVDPTGVLVGVSVTFDDITRFELLRDRLQRSNQELETAYEELQSTNEELQSTIEELETTNEELQSSNEELETMNEELQSSNAEQEHFNRELLVQTEEIDKLNAYMEAILSSLTMAVVVVDEDFGVRVWNTQAFDLWGLRADEVVGRSLLNLDIGLDVALLADPIRACLAGENPEPSSIEVTTRRGRRATCRVVYAPLEGAGAGRGVVVLMETLHEQDDGG